MDPQKVSELKAFVSTLEADPALLHLPQLAFFKKYLEGMGAKIPEKQHKHEHGHAEHKHEHGHAEHKHEHGHAEQAHGHGHAHGHTDCCGGHGHGDGHGHEHEHGHKHEHSHGAPKDEKKDAEEEDEEQPEAADPDLMPPDSDPPAEMGSAAGRDLSEDELEQLSNHKMGASEAAANGDFSKAVAGFTAALKLMPSPLLYAKRADAFLKLKKPNAAVRDCGAAIDLNPDSAKALRTRGVAYRYLGEYEKAQADLSLAQRIDYDDTVTHVHEYVKERLAKLWKKEQQDAKAAGRNRLAKMGLQARHDARGGGARRAEEAKLSAQPFSSTARSTTSRSPRRYSAA